MPVEILGLENVRFAYPGRPPVLEGVSLAVADGERLALLGPNGAGKTTLFQVIMGLQSPESGHVRLLGEDVAEEADFKKLRRTVGFLFQNPDDQLFCPTVLDDVAFGPRNLGLDAAGARMRAEETLELLGIADFAPRVTHRLSQGEKRLVALATVLAMQPRVLILDEPTAGLDTASCERLVEVLSGLDLGWIVSAHDMDFLLRTCNRFVRLDEGRIMAVDRPEPHAHTHVHLGGAGAHEHGESQT